MQPARQAAAKLLSRGLARGGCVEQQSSQHALRWARGFASESSDIGYVSQVRLMGVESCNQCVHQVS